MEQIVWTRRIPDRLVNTDSPDIEMLWFSGTDYLGLAHHDTFLHYIQEGLSLLGTHFGSSRNNTLRLKIFDEAELLTAQYLGADDAMILSSGMWAGQLLIKMLPKLIGQAYHIHYAPQVHPAISGEGYQPALTSWKDWAENTVKEISADTSGQIHVIVTDAVGAPWVEQYDFSVFNQLNTLQKIVMVVDDSHGLGIIGKEGRGTGLGLMDNNSLEVITVASLNKALGIPGGVIASKNDYLNCIRSSAWYSGASPLSPAYSYALCKMIESGTYRQLNHKLRQNLDYLKDRGLFASADWVSFEGYPVFCSKNQSWHQKLMNNNILTSCFAYPTMHDVPVLRMVINAAHTESDLKKLADTLIG